MISIYQPNIEKYSDSAISAIKTGWISNHGEYIEKTSSLLKRILTVKHCILMANGTCATHCLFLAIKHKHPEIQKIYVPNNCYVAAHNSSLMEYEKSQLTVMRMDLNTWNIDTSEDYIKTLDADSAVLIVHNLGNIVNVPRLKRIRPDVVFVEDNCEGIFGKYEGIHSGISESTLCSSVSFYGNKIITSGEGGAFFTNDSDVYNHIKSVYSQGMSNVRYLHNVHAYNYRMTNVQAAFIYDQLNDLDYILQNKRLVFENYKELLRELIDVGKVRLFECEEGTESSDWIFSVRLVGNKMTIEETTRFFNDNGVDIRPFFYPINAHDHLSDFAGNDPIAILLNKEVIMIPSSPTITEEEQQKVVNIIRLFLENIKGQEPLNIKDDSSITSKYRTIDILNCNLFSHIDKSVCFTQDNEYYLLIRNRVNSFIKTTLQTYNDKTVLEIGPKQNESERIYSPNNKIETVDIVSENNTTYVADLTKENELPKSYFDAVYCLEVLEHTYEPWEILKQINRLLKPDGYLHISIPFQFRIHGPLPDSYRINEFGLKYLLEKYDYEITHFDALIDKERPAFPIHYTVTCKKRA